MINSSFNIVKIYATAREQPLVIRRLEIRDYMFDNEGIFTYLLQNHLLYYAINSNRLRNNKC